MSGWLQSPVGNGQSRLDLKGTLGWSCPKLRTNQIGSVEGTKGAGFMTVEATPLGSLNVLYGIGTLHINEKSSNADQWGDVYRESWQCPDAKQRVDDTRQIVKLNGKGIFKLRGSVCAKSRKK